MSETSLFRRDPVDPAADRRHVRNVAILLFCSLMALTQMPDLLFRYLWIDVKSVVVFGEDPETAEVEVFRTIARDHPGAFQVVIRHATDHSVACIGSQSETFIYREAANVRNPIRMPLSEWFEGRGGDWQTCLPRLTDDTYYLATCHYRMAYGIGIGSRCVDSAVFRLGPVTTES